MRCEVEINISREADDEPRVPACLLDEDPNGAIVHTCPKDIVRLPKRYLQRLQARNGENRQVVKSSSKDHQARREKDLNTALKWIKQEILSMKEQDKSLMKQFIHLRSTISQLRCLYEMNSSSSDVSSIGGSNISLDESMRSQSPFGSPKMLSPIKDVEEPEFRSRTSSLLTPKKSPVTTIKWKSNEYI